MQCIYIIIGSFKTMRYCTGSPTVVRVKSPEKFHHILISVFMQCFIMYPVLWIGPLHLAVVTYLVYLEVGWFAFLMTAFTCIQIPLQVIIGIYYAKLRYV